MTAETDTVKRERRKKHAELIGGLIVFARENHDLVRRSDAPAWASGWSIPRRQSEDAARLLAVTGKDAVRHHEMGPTYSWKWDRILLPHPHQFDGDYQELTAVAHELVHWSGHQSRLDRPTLIGFDQGTPQRAAEECIAELGACLIIDALGYKVLKPWHLNYILRHTVKIPSDVLESVWTYIMQEASRACDFIIERMEG